MPERVSGGGIQPSTSAKGTMMTSSPLSGPGIPEDRRDPRVDRSAAAVRRRTGARPATRIATCALTATFALTTVGGALPAFADDEPAPAVTHEVDETAVAGAVPARLWELPLPMTATVPALATKDEPADGSQDVSVVVPEAAPAVGSGAAARPATAPATRADDEVVTVELANPGDRSSTVGDGANLTFTATASDGGPVVYTARGLPTRAWLEPTTGRLLGPITEAGVFDVQVTARHASGASDTVSFRWTVTAAPAVTVELDHPGDQANEVGDGVDLPVVASTSDGRGVTYRAQDLPDGLAIDRLTGVISGTTASAGTFSATVTADHRVASVTDSVTFEWRVDEAPAADVTVDLQHPGDQRSTIGQPVELEVSATASDDGTVIFAEEGLPDGLSLDAASGVITGVPTVAEYFLVKLDATHVDSGASDSTVFAWDITADEAEPAVTISFAADAVGSRSHRVGDVIDHSVAASASNAEPLVYRAAGLPGGLEIDAASGRITGTLTTPGEFTVEVTAVEPGSRASEVATFDWTVGQAHVAPVVAADPAKPAATLPATLPATGASGPLGLIATGAGAMVAAGAALMVAARRRVTQ